jgi:hypothetical protein
MSSACKVPLPKKVPIVVRTSPCDPFTKGDEKQEFERTEKLPEIRKVLILTRHFAVNEKTER